MRLHLIIPVLDEADNLQTLIPYLLAETTPADQITIADGGSTDGTTQVLSAFPDVRHLRCSGRGRALQMNEAAAWNPDPNEVLYFLHADTRPPAGFRKDIISSIEAGYAVGCYRFKFDMWHPLLSINAYFTRFKGLACRGGDQSLFITREAFDDLGGFRDMRIMEDYDIIQRVWASKYEFRVVPRSILVSARKYRVNGWFRVQMANLKVFRMYKAGAPQEAMLETYRRMLDPW